MKIEIYEHCDFTIVIIVLFLTITFAPVVAAQSRTTCAIAGRVGDEAGSLLPGAIVTIASTALIIGSQTVTTNENGRFRFSELPPGSYDLTAALSGYQTLKVKRIQVAVGMTAEIPVKLVLYAGEQTITVEAESRLIDPTTSSIPTLLPPDYIKSMPTDRDTSHILDLAPGINLESAYGGAEESGNSYEVDGVDISDPQGGAPWSFFNYSIIDQVELIGLGAPAEYGQFTGVVYNTVTKSGTNDFSGDMEIYYTGGGLSATSPDPNLAATIERNAEGNFQLAGPLRKNKLWYFAAAQYLNSRQGEGGPIETEKDPRIFLKLTSALNQSNTLDGWIEWDHTKITGRDGDAFTPLEATTGEDNPEVVGNLSWRSVLSQNSVVSIGWGGYSGHHRFNPQNGFDLPGHVDANTGIASVNASRFGIAERTRSQVNASLSQHVGHLLTGFHDFKFGGEVEYSSVHDRYGYPGNAFFSDNEGPQEDPSTGEDDFFTLAFIGGGYDAHGTGKRVSLFAQDAWRITPRLTINPGVRIDLNRGSVSNNINVFSTSPIAPRLGFAWNPGKNGHTIIRAHYGRYYEALYSAYFYYMDPGAFKPLAIQRIFNSSGFTETISSTQGQQYAMDPHIKQPRLDQYILGFDRQLPYGIVLSAAGIYRKNADLIETVSRDGIFVPVEGFVPSTQQQVTLYDYLNPASDVLIYTNPQGLERTYTGLILTASRHVNRNWQFTTSFVYSKARGNIDNLGFDETGTGGNTPFFDGHFLDTPNSLVNAQGRLTHDQKYQVKLQGTYFTPRLNLSLTSNYTYTSGDTWTPHTDCLMTDDGNGVLGDGIFDCHEFPQGPVVYLAEARGSRRLPARNTIDLRMQWQHQFVTQQQLALFFDIFNLTNQSVPLTVETMTDAEFGNPATLTFPRYARFGMTFSW